MTAAEMDALDRCCAEWMGWTIGEVWSSPPADPKKPWNRSVETKNSPWPHATRDWSDFGALLLAIGERGMEPEVVRTSEGHWRSRLFPPTIGWVAENAADPRVALCMAVSALSPPPPAGGA